MSWPGKGKVAVAGIGFSALTRKPEQRLGRLAFDAAMHAIKDAGLRATDIDGLATYPDAPFYGAGRRDGIDLVSVEYLLKHFPLAPDVRWYAQVEQGMIASAVIEAANAIIAG